MSRARTWACPPGSQQLGSRQSHLWGSVSIGGYLKGDVAVTIAVFASRWICETSLIPAGPDLSTVLCSGRVRDIISDAVRRNIVKPALQRSTTAFIADRVCYGVILKGSPVTLSKKPLGIRIAFDQLGKGCLARIGKTSEGTCILISIPDMKAWKLDLANHCLRSSNPGKQRRQESILVVFGISWCFTRRAHHLRDCLGHQIVDPYVITLLNLESSILTEIFVYTCL